MRLLLLTDQERERFAAYLEQEATNGEAMAQQIEKMGDDPIMAALAKRERTEALAANIVAKKLRSYESVKIG